MLSWICIFTLLSSTGTSQSLLRNDFFSENGRSGMTVLTNHFGLNFQVTPWAGVVKGVGFSAVNIHKSCLKGYSGIR